MNHSALQVVQSRVLGLYHKFLHSRSSLQDGAQNDEVHTHIIEDDVVEHIFQVIWSNTFVVLFQFHNTGLSYHGGKQVFIVCVSLFWLSHQKVHIVFHAGSQQSGKFGFVELDIHEFQDLVYHELHHQVQAVVGFDE